MNFLTSRRGTRGLFFSLGLAFCLASAPIVGAFASPGAHGPNGEHLDEQPGALDVGSVPRFETFTEMFELVGQLSGGELSLMVDRYETNEPVLNGKLEVEYKGHKAVAKFHPDMGDYAIDDPKLVKALSAPGKHALLFTFIAGEESDLLEGTLVVAAEADDDHGHGLSRKWLALGVLGGAAVIGLIWFVRRRGARSAA